MFKVLAIGVGKGVRAPLGLHYMWLKTGGRVQFNIPRKDALAAGLAPGMSVQFCFGEEKAAGKFAISKGTENSRVLRAYFPKGSPKAEWSRLLLILPAMAPLAKAFPGKTGKLVVEDADPKGVLVFSKS